jgi:hypothetical protein
VRDIRVAVEAAAAAATANSFLVTAPKSPSIRKQDVTARLASTLQPAARRYEVGPKKAAITISRLLCRIYKSRYYFPPGTGGVAVVR